MYFDSETCEIRCRGIRWRERVEIVDRKIRDKDT